ncbi:COBRA-like protein 6 [Jatropha curcas]|uniref:COBRA-like protein 6 n=1 Tax=Jatropha curcas TaxID=180498 RepID=UPI0018945510|nr:COBRA-like protein 6 [Jatropha curcas]
MGMFWILIFFSLIISISPSYGFDPLDPHGNITIKWDLLQSSDTYDLKVSIFNYQLYRHVESPGWKLGWDWKGHEVIWGMWGAEATEQGNCTRFKGTTLPHCCEKSPVIVDLLPHCAKKRISAATPKCCVSLSAFYNDTIVPCPKCSCRCQEQPGAKCVKYGETPSLLREKQDSNDATLLREKQDSNDATPEVVRCTQHMCPIRVHWHVKESYKEYWRVKMTINNLNIMKNYSQWNLVVLHPNFKSLYQVFSFNYEPLDQYGNINDTGMFWGIEYYNAMLLQEGDSGNVQTEILLHKDEDFTFREGWALPRRVLFNGDECVMPQPDDYPRLPNYAHTKFIISSNIIIFPLLLLSIIIF